MTGAGTPAALYLRVSSTGQSEENQAPDLHRLAAARGWDPVVEYREVVSGAATSRPVLDKLLRDARAGKIGVIAVWAIDRLSRQGAGPVLNLVSEMDRVGVALVSLREPWLDTSGPFRDVIVAFAATMAKLERDRTIERVRAGLERARRQGKRLGRPPASPVLLRAARDLVMAGAPVAEAARRKGVARTTLQRFLRAST